MTYFVLFGGLGFVLWWLAVVSNLLPYYGVVGLVLASIVGYGWLLSLGVSFVSVVFMVYLGGMLVGFVYSVSLAADPFPEAWGDWSVMGYSAGFVLVLVVEMVVGDLFECWKLGVVTVDSGGMPSVQLDFSGMATFYLCGVGMFVVAGWGFLLTFFVLLELVQELPCGAIQAV